MPPTSCEMVEIVRDIIKAENKQTIDDVARILCVCTHMVLRMRPVDLRKERALLFGDPMNIKDQDPWLLNKWSLPMRRGISCMTRRRDLFGINGTAEGYR